MGINHFNHAGQSLRISWPPGQCEPYARDVLSLIVAAILAGSSDNFWEAFQLVRVGRRAKKIRLDWTYGGSQTPESDASSKVSIHTRSQGHTPHLHTTYHYSFISAVHSSSPLCRPIIREPAPHEHRGNSGSSFISWHPSWPQAAIQKEGWSALPNASPQRGRMRWKIKWQAHSTELFQRPVHCGLLPVLFFSLFWFETAHVSWFFCACVLSEAVLTTLEILSRSHGFISMWNRGVLWWSPGWQRNHLMSRLLMWRGANSKTAVLNRVWIQQNWSSKAAWCKNRWR